jgi:hypothetical protein
MGLRAQLVEVFKRSRSAIPINFCNRGEKISKIGGLESVILAFANGGDRGTYQCNSIKRVVSFYCYRRLLIILIM